MKKLIASAVIGLISLDILLLLSTPLKAQEIQETAECTATVAKMRKTIEKGRHVLVSVSSSDISKNYSDHPLNRPNSYSFLMQGSSTEAIMRSPNFMKIIATKIVNSCNSVSLIDFSYNNSGWVSVIGLMPNGSMEFFSCYDLTKGETQIWGKQFCD